MMMDINTGPSAALHDTSTQESHPETCSTRNLASGGNYFEAGSHLYNFPGEQKRSLTSPHVIIKS
jgi:hypothetical protein